VNAKGKKTGKGYPKALSVDEPPSQNALPNSMADKLSEHEILSLFEKMLVCYASS